MTRHPAYIHVLTSIENEASGPTYSVRRLAETQARLRRDVGVYSLAEQASKKTLNGVVYQNFARSWGSFPLIARLEASHALSIALNAAAKQGALLHAHGLWRLPNVYPSRATRRYKNPLVLSPRGMLGLAALDYSATQKRLFWYAVQASALASVDCFHATSHSEAEDIRRMGLTAPVAVIPNGIDIPAGVASYGARTILHLGRLHPKKGIDQLVAAWAQVAERHSDWRLRIVGPSEVGYRDMLERQIQELSAPRVDFDGPLFGQDKLAAYQQSGLFVLPTLNENFGIVVAEALAAGIPVISTKGAPWRGLQTERCGWWTDHGAEALAVALDTALSLPDAERAAMGARGRDWMARDFGWGGIATRMEDVYAWCLGRGDQPGSVVMR